ncbi:MAG: hypothetical protein QOG43_420 [Actinomycetota bacterium]|jgi:hypothetical protein|nr:hypothetical protein [Actinomycetota bacterium]
MDDRTRLSQQLRDAFGKVQVETLSEQSLRVTIPTGRHKHDSTALGLERSGDGWVITDGGQLAFVLDSDLDRIVDLLQCAGASFRVDDEAVSLFVEDDANLVSATLAFAHYLAAAPLVWHALECAKRPLPATTTVDIMARETKGRLVEQLGEKVDPFIQLKLTIKGHGETFPVPLAIGSRSGKQPPALVASFIDTTAPQAAVTAAKRNTAFMLQVVRELAIPKYLVVRGDQRAVEHFADFYDPLNTTALSSERLETLYEDANRVLVGLRVL